MKQDFRIAYITGSLGKGGAEKQFYYFLKSLKNTAIKIKIFSLVKDEYYEKPITDLGYEIVWIGQSKNPFGRLFNFIKQLNEFNPEIIHSIHFFTNFYAIFGGFFTKTKSVGAIRSNVDYELKKTGLMGIFLLCLPNFLIVNSINAFDKLKKNIFLRKKVYLLRNVILNKDYILEKQTNRSNDMFTILTVARLSPVKRLDRFIKIIDLLKEPIQEIRGIIVGDGEEKENLISLRNTLNLNPESVLFLGMRDDIPQLLSQADIFLLTSDHEGIPNAMLEAMSAGLPIVTTPAGDCASIIHHGINGFVIDYDDQEKFVEGILKLYHHEQLRKEMGKINQEIISKEYRFENLKNNLITIYQTILN